MIKIDDFIMLGKTVPEPQTRSGRIFVCSAGYSPQLRQLVRVYPLARRNAPRRWHVHQVQLERPLLQDDSRDESWKIAGPRGADTHEWINDRFTDLGELARTKRPSMFEHLFAPSIKHLNERRASLGLIFPRAVRLRFEHAPDHPDSPLLRLFDPGVGVFDSDGPRFPMIPRLEFDDDDGHHRLMLRDWGVFELMRKHGPEYVQEHLAGALHLTHDSALLVGNLNHQRTAWLVIAVLNGLKVPTLQLEFAS